MTNRSEYKKRKMKKNYGKVTLLVTSLLILNVFIFMQFYIKTRDVSALTEPLPTATVIYDREGEQVSVFRPNKVEGIATEEIPDIMKLAVVAVEDQRFYEHDGFDIVGTGRAMFTNLKARRVVQGGSTLTQQMVKNVFLTHDQTFKRKLDEYFLAKKVEQQYSKNEILGIYLNQVYFGEGAWGIKRAAEIYYGKEPKDLTLNEVATLAGLLPAPSVLNPIKNEERAKNRRNVVLQLMYEQQFISRQQLEETREEPIELNPKSSSLFNVQYPSYMTHVIQEAVTMYGISESEVLSGGYHIYTALDQPTQSALENIYAEPSNFPKGSADEIPQSSGIIIHPETGGILALIGGRENKFQDYNRVSRLTRQPGSTIKPLLVYTPALENGYDMFDMLNDSPVEFGNYKPQNFSRTFKGEVSMYDAVLNSYNVPAVSVLHEMGLSTAINMAKKLYLPITENDHNLAALALGGLDKGVTLQQMAEAYTIYPNKGEIIESHTIKKIVDRNGDEVATFDGEKERVASEEVVQKMTYMLKGVVDNGTGRNAQIAGREVAGKTGSTQVVGAQVNGTSNQWFIGYTPELVGAFWIGYDRLSPDQYIPAVQGAGNPAAKLFQQAMSEALIDLPKSSFGLPAYKQPKPKSVEPSSQAKPKKEEKKPKKEEKKRGKEKAPGQKKKRRDE
ncbi:transglycosylase domain-containing protein [Bacillus sp. FJAT-45066]|uniref:transglycosylase domain-containing protein n=1 Tax=Bacillus sp. FJAT-45066 TaxID=2011010 RepID=UPI000BB83F91|nr:PBP1A family penicillin-binding protein [Bacillus sp. FJAT-45066]